MNKNPTLTSLEAAAYELVNEVWEGKWDHVSEVKAKPIGEWTTIPMELERRCPGYATDQYARAVQKGMVSFK